MYGKLEFAVCSFFFFSQYGNFGKEIIDVHHATPLRTLKPGEKTRTNDLALLYSNCHSVFHSAKPWLTIDQLKGVLCGG